MQSKHSQKTSSSKKRDLQSLSDFIGGSKVSVSGSSTSTSEWNEYIRKVTEIIKRHWDAPQTATKGSYVQLSITISRSGRILSSSVKGFSGGNSLKNSGIRCLKKIKSFPDFPKSVKNSQDTLSVKLVVN